MTLTPNACDLRVLLLVLYLNQQEAIAGNTAGKPSRKHCRKVSLTEYPYNKSYSKTVQKKIVCHIDLIVFFKQSTQI